MLHLPLAGVFLMILLLGCAPSVPEKKTSRGVGGPQNPTKAEEAKWREESLALMKALQTLEVTTEGTGKKRKVIWFTDSTFEKAEAAAVRFYPEFNKVGDDVDAVFIETDKSIIKLLAKGESDYLAGAILGSVGNFAISVHSRNVVASNILLAKANANISGKGERPIGNKSGSDVEEIAETTNINKTTAETTLSSFFFRYFIQNELGIVKGEMVDKLKYEYTVKGKAGNLVLRIESDDSELSGGGSSFNRSLQQNGLSVEDFVGGLLEEANKLYSLVICTDQKATKYRVYFLVNHKKSGE